MRLGEWSYFLAATLLALIALGFGFTTTVHVSYQGGGFAPNLVGACSALGFALASGLCFLAAAVSSRKDRP